MPSKPAISYRNVTKSFGPLRAVDDVSLDIAEGEFLAVVGGSGSGKTTLLRLANRLIEADGGTITVEGEDVQNVDPVALRRRIGYVFQSGGLFPHLSVADNIGITPRLLGAPAAEIAARVNELIELVQLDRASHRDRLPAALSGGQRQRVGVARALAARPRIVLMDEPFGALDTHTKIDMHDVLLRIWEREKQTVLFVTHDLGEALTLADRIILFSARPGRIKESFEVDFARPRNAVKIRETPRYAELFQLIWHSLGEEFIRGRKP